ncbi:putative transferase, protein kinase RLK-Pelle-RLCK-VIIa-2 family [Helianthus debilis subsp. tardiflorus]
MSLIAYVTSPQGPLIYSSSTSRTNTNLRIFSFHELLIATRYFRHGTFALQGHSEVYKGWIDEPSLAAAKPGALTLVAVKKFNMDNHQEWMGELTYLGTRKLSHPNLLKLIGYYQGYYEGYNGILVYEFMSRGSLEDQLFRRGMYLETLSWGRRIKIALGAATYCWYHRHRKPRTNRNGWTCDHKHNHLRTIHNIHTSS